MKEKYLEELKALLGNYNISQDEKDDILADYGEMIDDALGKGMDEEKIIKMIGSPEQVIEDLAEDFKEGEEYIYIQRHGGKSNKAKDNRLTALMPFISLIVFFALGFGFNLWHPGWLVFLSIPITAIIINAFDRHSMNGYIALSPFVALIAFLILGFTWNLWHPGWLVFLIVPVIAIASNLKTMKFISFLTAISPFVAVIIFIMMGHVYGLWNPMWLVFLIIPMIGILHEEKVWKVLSLEAAFIISIGAYLYAGYAHGEWALGALAFLLPLGVSILLSDEPFVAVNKGNRSVWILALICILVYIGLGLLFSSTWAYMWMIFLLIPVYAILKHGPDRKDKLIACMPFISTVIFFSLGFFLGWWAFSWLAFLLIPMTAIIIHAK